MITSSQYFYMLALVLLTRGYKDFAESNDFDRAADLTVDVINNYDHVLLDDVAAFYDPDNEQNPEIIWFIQYSQDKLLNLTGNYSQSPFTPWYEVYNDGIERSVERGYGKPSPQYRPTLWLLENFKPLDVDSRFEKSMQSVFYYNTTNGIPTGASVGDTGIWITDKELSQIEVEIIQERLPGVNVMSWNRNNIGDPWSWNQETNWNIWPRPWKFEDHKREDRNDNWGVHDVYVYRISETYLIAAEAMFMRDGNGDAAVDYLNTIRRRAAWPRKENEMEISSTDVDLDFILDERSRELFGEDKRWFDLKRTGKLLEREKKYNPEAAPNIQDYHILRPIPANQINRVSNEYNQNPGIITKIQVIECYNHLASWSCTKDRRRTIGTSDFTLVPNCIKTTIVERLSKRYDAIQREIMEE
jgi:starch-binding outer membrane protein, SusD/RagB family